MRRLVKTWLILACTYLVGMASVTYLTSGYWGLDKQIFVSAIVITLVQAVALYLFWIRYGSKGK